MTEKWIILLTQLEDDLNDYDPFIDFTGLEQFAAVDENLHILIFDSFEDCVMHQESKGIDGRCVELPLY
jgi:hypothetical protein